MKKTIYTPIVRPVVIYGCQTSKTNHKNRSAKNFLKQVPRKDLWIKTNTGSVNAKIKLKTNRTICRVIYNWNNKSLESVMVGAYGQRKKKIIVKYVLTGVMTGNLYR